MDEMLAILKEVRPDVDFVNEKKLIDDDVLDSFDIIAIVSDFNEAFDIEIEVEYLEAEHFNSIEAMWQLIQSLQG